mgnify:CR=1 FL=1
MAQREAIVIHKNRKRALWALVIIFFMIPVSGWLLVLGLRSGRPEIGWSMVLFGALGLVVFGGSAVAIIRIMRAPWHLALTPEAFTLCSPTYDLRVPWDRIAGIAVAEVNRRLGCVLVFDDVAAVARSAVFHPNSRRPDAITGAAEMQARMEENLTLWGYHLGLPGRMLEMGPEPLAELLTRARTGELWRKEDRP